MTFEIGQYTCDVIDQTAALPNCPEYRSVGVQGEPLTALGIRNLSDAALGRPYGKEYGPFNVAPNVFTNHLASQLDPAILDPNLHPARQIDWEKERREAYLAYTRRHDLPTIVVPDDFDPTKCGVSIIRRLDVEALLTDRIYTEHPDLMQATGRLAVRFSLPLLAETLYRPRETGLTVYRERQNQPLPPGFGLLAWSDIVTTHGEHPNLRMERVQAIQGYLLSDLKPIQTPAR